MLYIPQKIKMLYESIIIDLNLGWNMIGYLRLEGADAGSVLADLVDAGVIEIVKDYLGSAFLPEWDFNGIGNMNPGMGYQIKTSEAATLTLNANDTEY